MEKEKNTIEKTQETKPKILEGVVVSDKMQNTIVVKVQRFVKHPKYQKYVKIAKKFKAHDEGNTAKIGDKVKIKETRPISKDKHFILVK
jgi:small subunit ribosomal protein S17